MKRGLYLVMGVVMLGGVITAIGGAQVYPTRWPEEPQPATLAAVPDAVVLGNGSIALNPDVTIEESPFGGQGSGKKVQDSSCTSSNRGEIRILNLSDGGVPGPQESNMDALCFCQRTVVDEGTPTYAWSCFKTQ